MRKHLLLFLAALCATVAVKAETITLEPGVDKIKGLIDAGTLADGDVIELQTGTYTEWNALEFSTKVTLKAAEGATPIVQPNVIKIKNDFEANGITFINLSKDNYLLRTGADVAGTIAIKNCNLELNAEVTNPVPYIYLSSNTVGNLVIDSCTFAPNAKTEGAIVSGLTTVNNFTMTNSTAVACGGTDLAVYMTGLTTATVDHCTFYNCGARVLYLKGDAMTSCAVSNCVVSNPSVVTNYCFSTYAGTVENCVYFNLSAPRDGGVIVTNCTNANPLFVDASAGNFNFSMFSPLFLAATDGSNIGDPRWEAQSGAGIDLPTDATPVVLDKGNVGAVSADMTYYGEDGEYFDFGPEEGKENKSRWASWAVNIDKGAYKVTADVEDVSVGYYLQLEVINTTTGKADTFKTEYQKSDFGTLNLCDLTSGQYIVRLKNTLWGGQVKVKSLTFEYAGGAVVDADLLPNDDAVLVGRVARDENNNIKSSGHSDVPTAEYFYWNVNFTEIGDYTVSINVAEKEGGGSSGHIYQVFINDADQPATKEKEYSELAGECNLTNATINIPIAGVYQIKIVNNQEYSSAMLHSFTLTHAGGGVVTIPETLFPADAMLSENAFIDNDTIIFAPRGAEGLTPDGWAKWNVTLEKDALCSFKANCHRFSGNTMKIKISVINSENDTIYQKEENVENSGDSEVALGNIMLAAGDYVIQMQNTTQYSRGRLMSVVVTAQPIITITDDSDIDFTDYAGQMVTVQLMRTFKANMWNPICLPFGVEHSKLQSILNCETSYLLNNASLENQKLFVELAASQYNDIYNGSPYMIKPSEDVKNPIFENVKIMETPYATSSEKGVLKLQGSFASHIIDNHQNALLVGANNTLFFPSDEHPYIKSMRAYFILKDVEPSQMPRFAAFVEPGNAPTEMIIVGGEAERQKGHRKVLVDGQIRIQHEGKCYSILGLER